MLYWFKSYHCYTTSQNYQTSYITDMTKFTTYMLRHSKQCKSSNNCPLILYLIFFFVTFITHTDNLLSLKPSIKFFMYNIKIFCDMYKLKTNYIFVIDEKKVFNSETSLIFI